MDGHLPAELVCGSRGGATGERNGTKQKKAGIKRKKYWNAQRRLILEKTMHGFLE